MHCMFMNSFRSTRNSKPCSGQHLEFKPQHHWSIKPRNITTQKTLIVSSITVSTSDLTPICLIPPLHNHKPIFCLICVIVVLYCVVWLHHVWLLHIADRGRSRKKRRDFFGTIKKRLSRSKIRSKSMDPGERDESLNRDASLSRSISADRARDPSAHSTGM